MQIIQGITFRDESIRLDGKHIIDCIFIDCTLEYSGGDIVFERTSMFGCHHQLYGYARQTARYMRNVGLMDETQDKWTDCTGRSN